MLTEGDTPARVKAQPAIKTSACRECGDAVEFTTCPKKFCLKCSAARKLASARVAMTKQRRKHGVAQVKGTVIACDRCGRAFERDGIKARFCEECAPEATLERARRHQEIKRRSSGIEPLGKVQACANCRNPFIKQTSAAIYCVDCMALRSLNKLPEMRASIRAWRKHRYATDPAFVVNENVRNAIRVSLQGAKAGRHWEALVGYALAELMRHLERQFLPGMTWENYGPVWHVDHIVPLSSFHFDSAEHPDFRAAWAITNLRPLWAEENLEKRAQRTHLL